MVHLWTTLLRSQKHFFVADALDFAAVHCGALCAAVSQLRTSLQPADLEETEAVLSFLATLMDFSRQWRQRHRQSFDTLLAWLKGCVGICFWYVCRPTVVVVLGRLSSVCLVRCTPVAAAAGAADAGRPRPERLAALAEPARRSSGTGSHEPLLELRAALLTGLHQTLTLVLEQAVLHRLLPPADADDQPLSWDQLREELKPFLDSVRRQQQGRSSPHPQEGGPPADQALLPLLDRLVNAVLK
ncbi:uncharacterized protein LOC119095800 [Pollicipes pollicipes]|uniref:uncharacterized protein LOC119095800 n=1 Tax=Pollicipes pollicipes TaxID=41117 RepID=UPI001884E609|nr:uncharacterized protein LOC119095800 [Pollicipes pollicipes]